MYCGILLHAMVIIIIPTKFMRKYANKKSLMVSGAPLYGGICRYSIFVQLVVTRYIQVVG
jgi:hypothetical protein